MPQMHLKVVLSGSYNIAEFSEEVWSMGIKFACDDSPIPDVGSFSADNSIFAQDNADSSADYTFSGNFGVQLGTIGVGNDLDPVNWLVNQVGPAAKAMVQDTTVMAGHARLRAVTVYALGANGKTLEINGNPAKAQAAVKGAIGGSDAQAYYPLQVAAVASLGTYRGGKSGRGRIFFPAQAVGSASHTTQPWLSVAGQNAKAQAVKTFLNACTINDSVDDIYVRPVVTGSVNATEFGAIKNVRVGRVYDTQRRRRNALSENYVTVNL